MQCFGSHSEQSGGEMMNVMGTIINHGRDKNMWSPGYVTSSEKRSCSPVCLGSSEDLSHCMGMCRHRKWSGKGWGEIPLLYNKLQCKDLSSVTKGPRMENHRE